MEDIPLDVTIEVRDYHTRRYEGTQLSKDEEGRPCLIKEWHAPE